MLNIGWIGDLYLVLGLLVLFAFYSLGKVKGWWDPKAQKAAKRRRKSQRRRARVQR